MSVGGSVRGDMCRGEMSSPRADTAAVLLVASGGVHMK